MKDNIFEKNGTRERRSDRERERSETKTLSDRDRTSQRIDNRYDRNTVDKDTSVRKTGVNSPRDRVDRFPRERSLDRTSLLDKGTHNVPPLSQASSLPVVQSSIASSSSSSAPPTLSNSRDNLIDRIDVTHYDRERHRRFSTRYDRNHTSEHDQSRITPTKVDRLIERRESSPRRTIEIDRNYNRNYGRLSEHWDEQEEASSHLDYRDHHVHEDDRRKTVDGRRYDSPFDERRGIREERSRESRYVVQTTDRSSFDDHRHHHHHHRHPLYSGEKLRSNTSIRYINN